MLTIVGMFAIIVCASIFTACSQDDYLPEVNQTGEAQLYNQSSFVTRSMSTTYLYQPTKGGGYVAPNTSNDHVGGYWNNGTFVSHTGGAITARVLSITGEDNHELTIEISKPNGGTFSLGGLAYIKCFAPTGPIASNANGVPYSSGDSTVNLHVDLDSLGIDLSYGCLNLYPTVIVGSNRYYANPILVYTYPWYNNASFTLNTVLGKANNVEVRANGSGNMGGGINQCVAFCKRYYTEVYHKNLPSFQNHAKNIYYIAQNSNDLVAYANGNNSVSGAPRAGDILVFDKGTYDDEDQTWNGHVAIIVQVASSFVKIAQQNSGEGNPSTSGWSNPIGGLLTRSGNTIYQPNASYPILGWVRVPEQ